jgi:hypothetical protein
MAMIDCKALRFSSQLGSLRSPANGANPALLFQEVFIIGFRDSEDVLDVSLPILGARLFRMLAPKQPTSRKLARVLCGVRAILLFSLFHALLARALKTVTV